MKKTGIFYGSTTGTTESVARLIAEKLGVSPEDVHDVSKLDAALAESYEALILGTSTWGDGELQDDWYDALDRLRALDLTSDTKAVEDMKGNRLLLFTSDWAVRWAETHNETLELSEFGNI